MPSFLWAIIIPGTVAICGLSFAWIVSQSISRIGERAEIQRKLRAFDAELASRSRELDL